MSRSRSRPIKEARHDAPAGRPAARPDAARPPSSNRVRRPAGAVVIAGLAAAAVGAAWWTNAQRTREIPEPPAVARQLPAVAEHLQARYLAAKREPRSTEALSRLCLAYHADMVFDRAEACWALLARREPGEWRWVYYRALILAERGGGAGLPPLLERVVEIEPSFGPAWLRLGDAAFKAGRYEEAERAWQRASELPEPAPHAAGDGPRRATEAPLHAYARLGLARLALGRGDAARARELLEPVVAAVPHFGVALRVLADSYRALGRHDEAARAVRRASRLPAFAPYADPMVDALALESRHSTLLLRLASEANLSLNARWSEFLTRRAAEFDPGNPDVVVKLGRILREVGRDEEALEWFLRYHEMVPGDFQGLAHIGGSLSALGRYDEAESYFRRALAGSDDPVTHYNLGLLMSLRGRTGEAIAAYERALERDPSHEDARSNLAAALVRASRPDRALRELLRVLDENPDNALARANLGLLYAQQGRVRDAVRELEHALAIDPGMAPVREALRSLRPGG